MLRDMPSIGFEPIASQLRRALYPVELAQHIPAPLPVCNRIGRCRQDKHPTRKHLARKQNRASEADMSPTEIVARLGRHEKRALIKREGASEAVMSWKTAQRLHAYGLMPRVTRYLRVTPLGMQVRHLLLATEPFAHPNGAMC